MRLPNRCLERNICFAEEQFHGGTDALSLCVALRTIFLDSHRNRITMVFSKALPAHDRVVPKEPPKEPSP
jgi:hypothetical protein